MRGKVVQYREFVDGKSIYKRRCKCWYCSKGIDIILSSRTRLSEKFLKKQEWINIKIGEKKAWICDACNKKFLKRREVVDIVVAKSPIHITKAKVFRLMKSETKRIYRTKSSRRPYTEKSVEDVLRIISENMDAYTDSKCFWDGEKIFKSKRNITKKRSIDCKNYSNCLKKTFHTERIFFACQLCEKYEADPEWLHDTYPFGERELNIINDKDEIHI